jgi:hypothetical protein
MLRRVALVRPDISEELSSSFIWVTRICELGTTLAVTMVVVVVLDVVLMIVLVVVGGMVVVIGLTYHQ